LLHVGRIVAGVAAHDRIFTGFGKYLEFMRPATPNRPGIRLHRSKSKTAAPKNAFVSLEHLIVLAATIFNVRVEAVGIFHRKLAAAHQTEPRSNLIPELGLNLIKVQGKLSGGTHDTAHEVGE